MSIEQLLHHRDFLAALARGLVVDPSVQDELVWETIGEGATKPPPHTGLRPWLARVMRNRASDRVLARQRRQAHERAGAKPDHVPSTADLAVRLDLYKKLVQHVQALDPDYREVVLLRFFEELSPREIAKQLSLPLETVKTRLRRALVMLRTCLDQEHGSRHKWLGSLLPIAFPTTKTTGLTLAMIGAILMSIPTKVAVATCAALLFLGTWAYLADYSSRRGSETVDIEKLTHRSVPPNSNEDVRKPAIAVKQTKNPARLPHEPEDAQEAGDVESREVGKLENPLRLSQSELARIVAKELYVKDLNLTSLDKLGASPVASASKKRELMLRRSIAMIDIIVTKLRSGDYRLDDLSSTVLSSQTVRKIITGWTTIGGQRYGVVVEIELAMHPTFSSPLKQLEEIQDQELAAWVSKFNALPIAIRKQRIQKRDAVRRQIRKLKADNPKELSLKKRELLRTVDIPPILQVDRTYWTVK